MREIAIIHMPIYPLFRCEYDIQAAAVPYGGYAHALRLSMVNLLLYHSRLYAQASAWSDLSLTHTTYNIYIAPFLAQPANKEF